MMSDTCSASSPYSFFTLAPRSLGHYDRENRRRNRMMFSFNYRELDSPLVEMVYHTQTARDSGESFISNAESRWEMVVTKQKDKTILSMRGPESKASTAPIPEDAEILGIVFKLGVFMPHLTTDKLVNEQIHLPEVMGNSFHLYHSA